MCAGTSAVGAICFTNPIDVVKTRMTITQSGSNNPLGVLLQIGRAEGLAGLQRGLGPSCFWQFSNVSVRFGVYGAAKGLLGISPSSDTPPMLKWLQCAPIRF